MIIGKDILESGNRLIGKLLLKHMDEIDKAYLKSDDAFSVGMKLKFKPVGDSIEFTASIEFIAEKVKDDVKGQLREGQEDMFTHAEKQKKEHVKELLSNCNTTCIECVEECENFQCRRTGKDNVVYATFERAANDK